MASVTRYFPQPGSTTMSLTTLTHHHGGLTMICHNLVKRAAEKHNSTSSFAGKAGQLHLYNLHSEITTEASKTTSQCVTAVYLQVSASDNYAVLGEKLRVERNRASLYQCIGEETISNSSPQA